MQSSRFISWSFPSGGGCSMGWPRSSGSGSLPRRSSASGCCQQAGDALVEYHWRCQQAEYQGGAQTEIEEISRLNQHAVCVQKVERPFLVAPDFGYAQDGGPARFGGQQCAGRVGADPVRKSFPVAQQTRENGAADAGAQLQQPGQRQLHGCAHGQIGVGHQFQVGQRGVDPIARPAGRNPAQLHLWQPARLGKTSERKGPGAGGMGKSAKPSSAITATPCSAAIAHRRSQSSAPRYEPVGLLGLTTTTAATSVKFRLWKSMCQRPSKAKR